MRQSISIAIPPVRLRAAWPGAFVTPLAALALFLGAAPAVADCVDGVRAATPAEQDFHARASAALAAAFPRAEAPLTLPNPPAVAKSQPLSSLCADTPVGGFEVSAAGTYVRNFTPAEQEARNAKRRALERRIEEMRQLPPALQAQQDELNRQATAVYATVPRRSRKDPPFTPEQQALVDQRSAEGRALETRAREVGFAHVRNLEPQLKPLRDEASLLQNSPQQIAAQLLVNPPEWNVRGGGDTQVVTFGPMLKSGGRGLTVKQVAIVVRGPPVPAVAAVLAGFDRAYLEGLVGKPLPTVAESVARAERVATVAVPLEAEAAVASAPTGAGGSAAAAAGAAAAGSATGSTTAAASPTAPASTTNCRPREASASGAVGTAGSALGGEVGRALGGLAVLGRRKKTETPPDCP